MATFEQWAQQMNVSWEKVLKKVGVTDPREGSRASRSRLAKGGAPQVRKKLMKALLEMERGRQAPTEIGSLFVSIEDWKDLGAELASLDPARFKVLLGALRREVEAKREETESPFFNIKPPEEPPEEPPKR